MLEASIVQDGGDPEQTAHALRKEESGSLQSSNIPSPALTQSTTFPRDRPSRLGDFFAHNRDPNLRYSDWDIQDISRHLQDTEKDNWSGNPRLYTVLRTIGQLQNLDTFLEQGITDVWFPFDQKSVPILLSLSMRNRFLETQPLVLTKALNLERHGKKHHAHFGHGDLFPFEVHERLGSGGYGTVDKIFSKFGHEVFARKLFTRQKGGTRSDVQRFRTELQILKRIKHDHCVELIASYTDSRHFGLIMSPVADCNLKAFYPFPKPVRRHSLSFG